MKHLIALLTVVLAVFSTYEIIHIDSKFWNGDDLMSTIYAFVLGVIITLTIILTLKMIYEKKTNRK
jgi:hypothetical protein